MVETNGEEQLPPNHTGQPQLLEKKKLSDSPKFKT